MTRGWRFRLGLIPIVLLYALTIVHNSDVGITLRFVSSENRNVAESALLRRLFDSVYGPIIFLLVLPIVIWGIAVIMHLRRRVMLGEGKAIVVAVRDVLLSHLAASVAAGSAVVIHALHHRHDTEDIWLGMLSFLSAPIWVIPVVLSAPTMFLRHHEYAFFFTIVALTYTPVFGLMLMGLRSRAHRPEPEATPQCIACGYDLRATPNRCPECGQMQEVGAPAPMEMQSDDLTSGSVS